MQENDREEVIGMMRIFYSSDAVKGEYTDDVFERDFSDCIGKCPYVEGYIFEEKGQPAGYAMTALSYSTEEGGPCVWVEDLYVKEAFRGRGYAEEFFAFLEDRHRPYSKRIRLECERTNETARKVYDRCGYGVLDYEQRYKKL